MINNFVHINISVKDLNVTREFYASIFNWRLYEIETMPGMLFFEVDKEGDGIEGGFALTEEEIMPGNIVLYVNVKDIPKILEIVEQKGGEIILNETSLPGGFGMIARFKDPFGNIIGLWKEIEK